MRLVCPSLAPISAVETQCNQSHAMQREMVHYRKFLTRRTLVRLSARHMSRHQPDHKDSSGEWYNQRKGTSQHNGPIRRFGYMCSLCFILMMILRVYSS